MVLNLPNIEKSGDLFSLKLPTLSDFLAIKYGAILKCLNINVWLSKGLQRQYFRTEHNKNQR